MNATHMMVSQGGMSLAGIVWGALATALSLDWALFSASALGIVSALTAKRWSIDFSTEMERRPSRAQTWLRSLGPSHSTLGALPDGSPASVRSRLTSGRHSRLLLIN
jgi:Transmembrane secretion effector